ncbi:polyketide synthase PksD [Phaeosphaeriaceae sp. PMI808]|nr:polyketide synthase PksD [Phaeosphaeriaceae sp. PMI808]
MEPLAIVGFSFKFPQDAVDEKSFWEILENGRNVMTPWPEERVNVKAFYDADSVRKNTLYSKGAHFIKDDPAAFDAPFFSITSKEAASMDPQQRWLLETAYCALENGMSYIPFSLPSLLVSRSQTGVFAASMSDDYVRLIAKDPDESPATAATGLSSAILANRISWFFDLKGPSLQVNTACSTGMIAMDIACQSLRTGQSSMLSIQGKALVAGCNTLLGPETSLMLSNMNFLSPDSLSYSFDHRANGYSRGEGVAVFVVKRLADAISNQDMIRAVIRATGTNQDGRTPGITQPSLAAQEDLIRQVYRSCALDFKATRYVEAHGTGTTIGDVTEAKALGRVFRAHRSSNAPLYIGSVKANIGHLEACSGLAGIAKCVLILEKGIIPPNPLFEKWNPKINAKLNNLEVATSCVAWPTDGLRRVSANSFGVGGSNGHIIMDDAYHTIEALHMQNIHRTLPLTVRPTPVKNEPKFIQNGVSKHPHTNGIKRANGDQENLQQATPLPSRNRLLVWCARDEAALRRMLQRYLTYYKTHTSDNASHLERLANTLTTRRSLMTWRSFAVANPEGALDAIKLSLSNCVRSTRDSVLAFIFTGQGAQYARMGLDLLHYPLFTSSLRKAAKVLRDLGANWDLIDKLQTSEDINNPRLSQPLCTALQIALIELLRSFNIMPVAVIGHSSGEIAAAYTIGALSFESALKVAYHRGRLAGQLVSSAAKPGAMMSVNMAESDAYAYVEKAQLSTSICIACINSPFNVTLSGDAANIEVLKAQLDNDGVFAQKIATGVAYHSPAMQQVSSEYLSCLGVLEQRTSHNENILMISSVTGKNISRHALSNGQYWVDNLISPVRFIDSLQYLALAAPKADGLKPISDYIEVGPHGALRRPVRETLSEISASKTYRYSALLHRLHSSSKTTLEVIGQLFARGYPVSLSIANQHDDIDHAILPLVDTPEYPFDHSQTYWYESHLSRNFRFRDATPRDLLGTRASDWNPREPRWRKMLSIEEDSWLGDHVVDNVIIFPATGTMMMAVEAVKQMTSAHQIITGFYVKEATYTRSIVIRPEERTEVVTHLRPLQQMYEKSSSRFEIQVMALIDGYWNECCKAIIHAETEEPSTEVDGGYESRVAEQKWVREYENAKSVCVNHIAKDDFYKWHQKQGINYREAFSLANDIYWDGDEQCIASIDIGFHSRPFAGIVHPAVFDASGQICYTAPSKGLSKTLPTIIPHKVQRAWISATGWRMPCTSRIRVVTRSKLKAGGRGFSTSLTALGDDNSLLCHIENVDLTPIGGLQIGGIIERKLLHGIDWKPQLSLLSQEQLQLYCDDAKLLDVESATADSCRKLSRILRTVIQQNAHDLADLDWAKAPLHMHNYVSWVTNESRNGLNREHLIVDIESLKMAPLPTNRLSQVAEKLLSAVQGELDLQAMLSDFFGGIQQEPLVCEHNSLIIALMQLLSHQTPDQRILEVGNETGGMSTFIIATLLHVERCTGGMAFSDYVYTAQDLEAVENVSRHFADSQDRLAFKQLDLGQDSTTQGFELRAYDTIFVGSKLLAAHDPASALANIRQVLKPNGHLIVHDFAESTCSVLHLGIASKQDTSSTREGSESTANAGRLQLDTALEESGLSRADLVIRPCDNNETAECTKMIICTAKNQEPISLEASRVLIVINGQSDSQISMASRLEKEIFQAPKHQASVVCLSQFADVNVVPTDRVILIADLDNRMLTDMTEETLALVKSWIQQVKNLLWISQSDRADDSASSPCPCTGLKDGFLRTLRSEFNTKKIISLTLEDEVDAIEHVAKVFDAAFADSSSDLEYTVRNGQVLTARLIEEVDKNNELNSSIAPQLHTEPWLPGPPLKLDIGSRGSLDTLHFAEDIEHYKPLGPKEVEVEAKAWGLNFRDVFLALGRLDEDEFGADCTGVVKRVGSECSVIQPGDRICLNAIGCMRMYPRAEESAVVKLADSVSFEEACAVISPTVTAWYSLIEVARLQAGDKILIHAASGATGQLAIQIAKMVGAEVFATVGYDHKKQLLINQYGLPEDHIFYSRNTSFAKGIMRITNGYGVDVVLNSLVGEGLRASWDCVAPYGRFVEIGKADINANASLPMSCFAKNVSFSAVDLRHVNYYRKELGIRLLIKAMELATERSVHYPKPLNLYDVDAVEDAFRYMQSGKNTGRIVVRIDHATKVQKKLVRRKTWQFDENSSYLIAGGLGGIGRSILKWMATRGAKYLIVPSRSGAASEAAAQIVEQLSKQGVTVASPKCDISCKDSLSQMLEDCGRSMPRVRGCINAAMVLNDSTFENMTCTQWERTIRSKVHSSWNIHTHLPDSLDFFVLLSSISGIVGNPGQSNYATGCTFQDSLARFRIERGQKATSIDLGVMRTIGIIAETEALQKNYEDATSYGQIEENEFLAILEIYCDPARPLPPTPDKSNVTMGLNTPVDALSRGAEPLEFLQRPLFRRFSQLRGGMHQTSSSSSTSTFPALLFRQAESAEERTTVVVESLAKKLARALSIQPEEVDAHRPLHAFGVDSLVAVELRNWIAREFVADVPVFEITGGKTVAAIGELVNKTSQVSLGGLE